MRIKVDWGTPRIWLLIVGVLLVAFPFSQRHSSAPYGAMLIVGAVLVVAVLANVFLQGRRGR